MLSISKSRSLMLLSLSLVALLLSACDASSSGASLAPLAAPQYPTQALVHRFDLSARQGLRDVTSDFSVHEPGADTGILLLPREKVEIFASGQAKVQPNGKPSQADGSGTFQCIRSAMPEPTLPCYSVIYSLGLFGRAGEVGARVEFNPTATGNLFLGINAPHVSTNSGSFHMTVLIIPPGAVAGLWATPGDSFSVQGTSMTLSAYAFGQNVANLTVNFTLMVGQTPVSLCSASAGAGDLFTCHWDLTRNGTYLDNGKSVLGFTINSQSQGGAALAPFSNPDGLRTGTITYEKTQFSSNYAGYAAIDFSGTKTFQSVRGSWTVPTANCAGGENSDSAIWIGMTPAPRNPTSDNPFYAQDSPIFQIGTDSGCLRGHPHYFIVWEQFPQPSVAQPFALEPGDIVTTAVTFQPGAFGRGDYTLSINVSRMIATNTSQGVYNFQTSPLAGDVSASAMAECIVEAPTLIDPNTTRPQLEQLTNFGKVNLTCNYNNDQPIANGPQDYIYKMSADSFLQTLKATTSDLDSSGATFTVTWDHG
jgi:hypothetical protein